MPRASSAPDPAMRKKPATEAPPKKKSKKASEAWSILAAIRRPFGERDLRWPTRRRVRQREEEPPVPEAYAGTTLRHKSAELDFMVRQIVALLADNKEKYVVYTPGATEDDKRLADETQQAVAALMELLEDQHPIERPRPIVHDYQVADGVAIEKLTFNWDFYNKVTKTKGEEEDWASAFEKYVRERREIPLRRSVIDPLTAYWEFDIDGLTAVVEYGKARRSALKDTYKDESNILNALARIPIDDNTGGDSNSSIAGINGDGTYSDQGDLVTVIEVWTRTEFMLLAEGEGDDDRELLVRQPHPFKRPPYFFAAGILTGHANPLHKWRPLVLAMYPLALELSAVRTARLNAAFLSSFKPFYIQYDGGGVDMDETAGGIKIHFLTPGNTIPSIKGGKIVPIDWTDLDELVSLEQSLMGDRDRFGFQAILAGNNAASGDSTAWATRMLRDQGFVQFNQVLNNYAQMREEEIRFIMDFVRDVLKDDLPVSRRVYEEKTGRGHIKMMKITTKMAEAGFDFQVKVSAGKAADRISLVEEFRRAHEAGEIPQRMVLEEGWQFQNVSQILDEVVDEKVRAEMMPQLIQMALQIAMAGALEELRKSLPDNQPPDPAQVQAQVDAEAAAAQQQMMGGGGGPPPMMGPGGGPPGGEMPPEAYTAGIGQGLAPPELPPDEMPIQV